VAGFARRLRASVAAAHGRWRDVRAQLDSAGAADGPTAAALQALLAAQPMLAVPAEERAAIVAGLAAWRAGEGADTRRFDVVREHRLGLLAHVAGDRGGLARAHAALAARVAAAPADTLAMAARASLASRLALADGHPEAALAALAALDRLRWPQVPMALSADAADRFFRAELLVRLGRDAEAAGWYASVAERASYELPWLAPAQLRLGELAERAGRREEARTHYARFAALWRDADGPRAALARDVARRLAALGG
jgi:hypothetical protein